MVLNGMWFQDAFNYDFSAICNSTILVETRQGEISFCAYYVGGWRKIVEQQNRTTALAEWHRNHGRNAIYANGKALDLERPAANVEDRLVQIESARVPIPTT